MGSPFVVLALLAAGPVDAAYPDEFPLFATLGHEGSGRVYLTQQWSPYGVSVDEEGRVRYDVRVEVGGLPPVEGHAYHVWLTTPSLDHVVHLGVIEPTGQLKGRTDLQQLIVVVSREPESDDAGERRRWRGPVVLRGFSAGARVTPMAQHSLFRPTPM